MLRQESDMWARGMERDAEQRRRDAAEVADMRRREKIMQPNTRPIGRWKVAEATSGNVTIFDYEAILLGHPGPSSTRIERGDLDAMLQLMHDVRMGGRIS